MDSSSRSKLILKPTNTSEAPIMIVQMSIKMKIWATVRLPPAVSVSKMHLHDHSWIVRIVGCRPCRTAGHCYVMDWPESQSAGTNPSLFVMEMMITGMSVKPC